MEDISNTSSSTSNLTYTDWMDMLRFMFADNISSGPNGLGNGEDYNSNSGTQQERPLDHGDATLDDLNDPFTWDFGNESLSAGSQSAIDYFNGNSAESWNNGGSQWAYEDRPHSHPSQGEHINVDTAAPRDLQLVPDQHLLAQNSGDSPFAAAAADTPSVPKHSCDKRIPMTKKAISKHLREKHDLKTRDSDVACGWQGCTWKKRGDTLVRHVMEVHLKIKGAKCSGCLAYFKSRTCRELKEHREEGKCRGASILYPDDGGNQVQCKYMARE